MKLTAAQEQAVNARAASIAVSAAAGSGKTTVMTKRIIKHVCEDGGDISRILAVTFTKAAAADILSKTARALSEKLAQDPSNEHTARQALLVGSAKISTIHSFCLDVIRENFASLSLPSDFSAADEATLTSVMNFEMERLIDDYFSGNVAGENAIDDFPAFSDTFGSLKNLNDLGENMIRIYNFLTKKVSFIKSLDDYVKIYEDIDADCFFSSLPGKYLLDHTRAVISHHLNVMRDFLEYASSNDNYAAGVDFLKYEVDYLSNVMAAVDGGADYFRISELLTNYHPTWKQLRFGNNLPADSKFDFFKECRKNFRADLVGTASSPSKFTSTYYFCTNDDLARFASETAGALRNLKKFLSEFDKRFTAEKMRRHVVSFADMEHYALAVLWDRERDLPSAEARRIADGFDEIYIDEYQDTNEVQDKIFSLISKGGNKFCVGDVKQSIYAFRGAEPSIFNKMLDGSEVYTDDFRGVNAKIFLSENFRSSNEIIAFCNSVFESVMNADGEHYPQEERLNSALNENRGGVEIAVMSGDDAKEREAEYVASRISEMISSGTSPNDIAVLLRTSTNVGTYESALKKHGVPYDNSMEKRFFESPEVLMVLSLLNAIDNPARDVYVAASLKSPIFGVSLDELIFIRRSYGGTLYDALCEFTREKGFKKGERFILFIDEFRALSRTVPCDRLLRRLYLKTDVLSIVKGENKIETANARSNLITLYNYSIAFSRGQYKTLYDFISLISDIIEGRRAVSIGGMKSAPAAVHIMTIHGSKGLEFPVCFLCSASSVFSNKDLTLKTRTGKDMMAPVIPDSSGLGHIRSPYYEIAGIPIKKERQNEEMRLLYVALTRAKDKLIVTGTSKSMPDFSDNGEHALMREYLSEYALSGINSYIDAISTGAVGKGTCVFEVDPEIQAGSGAVGDDAAAEDITFAEAKRLVGERLSFVYPYAAITDVPSKTAVSDLYPDLLDDDGAAHGDSGDDTFSTVPRFISEDDGADAARRGTATHTFMQFFDFDRIKEHGIDGEIRYLVDHKFIFGSDAEMIDRRALEKFISSPLAIQMRASKRIFREKRFIISMDAALFSENEETKKALKGEEMLVQGVIDCAFENDDGTITLVDYKTDHFPRSTPRAEIEKALRDRHSRQLGYYRAACETMFGKVAHVYIYSFAIGDTVEITGGQNGNSEKI